MYPGWSHNTLHMCRYYKNRELPNTCHSLITYLHVSLVIIYHKMNKKLDATYLSTNLDEAFDMVITCEKTYLVNIGMLGYGHVCHLLCVMNSHGFLCLKLQGKYNCVDLEENIHLDLGERALSYAALSLFEG